MSALQSVTIDDRPWNELSNEEKCARYEASYLAEYREDVEKLTALLATAKDNLKTAERQIAAGELVTSKFSRRWRLQETIEKHFQKAARDKQMTLDEARLVASIVEVAEGGCGGCINEACKELNEKFPEFAWNACVEGEGYMNSIRVERRIINNVVVAPMPTYRKQSC